MTLRRAPHIVGAWLAVGAIAIAAAAEPVVVEVEPGGDIQAAIDANPGAIIRLRAGRHEVSVTLLNAAASAIEGEGGDARAGTLATTLVSSAPVSAIENWSTEPFTIRNLRIIADAEGVVHGTSGSFSLINVDVASSQDPALPEEADGRGVVIFNVTPSDPDDPNSPPAPGGHIVIRHSVIGAGSPDAGPGDRDAVGIFTFFNGASYERIEATDCHFWTRQREDVESAFAMGFELLGPVRADGMRDASSGTDLVIEGNVIDASGYGIQVVANNSTARIEGNHIRAKVGGIMYASKSDHPGLLAHNRIYVTGEVGRGLPPTFDEFHPSACLFLGQVGAGFFGQELAGDGISHLVVAGNSLRCRTDGVFMATNEAFNTSPPIPNRSSYNVFVANRFRVSSRYRDVVLGLETRGNLFVANPGLRLRDVQDDGVDNRFVEVRP